MKPLCCTLAPQLCKNNLKRTQASHAATRAIPQVPHNAEALATVMINVYTSNAAPQKHNCSSKCAKYVTMARAIVPNMSQWLEPLCQICRLGEPAFRGSSPPCRRRRRTAGGGWRRWAVLGASSSNAWALLGNFGRELLERLGDFGRFWANLGTVLRRTDF